MNELNHNTILAASDAAFGAPRFDLFREEDYLPAFRAAIATAKAEVDAIVDDPREADFRNTVLALEYAGRDLSRVEALFFNLLEAESDPRMQEIAEEISPELTEYGLYVSLNDRLFERVKQVYDHPSELDTASRRLLEDTYRSFIRNGAALGEEDRKLFSELSSRLSVLELRFGNNVLSATNAFILHIEDEAELEGLPDYLREAAAQEAASRNLEGWVFTLQFPSYSPFLKYSARRELREKMWRAYNSRALGGEYDNRPVILEIVQLRMRIASLLGYPDYASYALERRMAGNRTEVEHFLDRLMEPALPKARQELSDVLEYARANGFEDPVLMPWDFPYWAERYRLAEFDFDERLLKPYFRLEDCVKAVFSLAGRLYGLDFVRRDDIPVYHKDVKVYQVLDENGKHLALFYADFFPRQGKRGGAWMTAFREQYSEGGVDYRPFISIVTNFTKPTESSPSLLTHGELTTLMHEFGHALHGMLSKGVYPSQCGTSVARDFVELPSQIMENWAFEEEFLDTFARHHITGERIPHEYIARIVRAKNCLSAYYHVRQLHFALLDMAWHSLDRLPQQGVEEFEHSVLGEYATLPLVEGSCISTSFNHIFAGGYSAGYYSYKWAEVLEADAFDLFSERGVFSPEVADSFRKNILERGSSEDERLLYRNFRGHDPEPEALLRKLEII